MRLQQQKELTLFNDKTEVKMLKSIDLFAGIGGIRLGFENAFGNELKTVFVSERDEYAQKTYKANFNDVTAKMQ